MTAAEFDGVAALATGGASGIGLATAQPVAAGGARVPILDRDNPRPEAMRAAGSAGAGSAGAGSAGADGRGGAVGQVSALDAVIADVTDDAAVRAAVSAAATTLGGIDILVNNAGVGAIGTVEDNNDEEWRRVFDVNVFVMVRTSRAALPHLRRAAQRRGAAVIVNTCSIVASAGLPQR